MGESPWTQCKKCNRVLLKGDEDEDGNCCFCEETNITKIDFGFKRATKEKKEEKKAKD